MKKLLLLFAAPLLSFSLQSQSVQWQHFTDSIVTFSSPRLADLNGDGVKDVVMGGGVDGVPTNYGVTAIDGDSGTTMWQMPSTDELFSCPIFQDITNDGNPDVFIGGRNAEFRAINGITGALIWEFFPLNSTVNPGDSGWYNFYTPQWIPDQNSDGKMDILVANGGDHSKLPHQTNRDPGHMMVLDAATGNILAKAVTPDSGETYLSPIVVDFFGDGTKMFVFGTGGEHIGGSLWIDSLSNLMAGDLSGATALMTDTSKGFVAPPAVADINLDSVPDIVAISFDGRVAAYDGTNLNEIWSRNFPGKETSTTPVIGNFGGGFESDVFLLLNRGLTPTYFDHYQYMLDGKDGQILFADSLGDLEFAPPVACDFDQNGRDELFFSGNIKIGAGYRNEFRIVDFANNLTSNFMSFYTGTNLTSSPWIGDMDGNGNLEIINVRRKANIIPNAAIGIYVQKINTFFTEPATGIAWGNYMGTNSDGHWNRNVQKNCPGLGSAFTASGPTCNFDNDGHATVFPTLGTAPYTINWNTGATGSRADSLTAGTYYARIVDAAGCEIMDTVTVVDPFEITMIKQDVQCYGDTTGAADVSSTGCQCMFTSCQFKWSTEDSVHTIQPIPAGMYYVTVTHLNGCEVVDSVEILQGDKIIDSVTVTNVSCAGAADGTLTAVPTNPGLSGLYFWNNGDTAKSTSGLGPGQYWVRAFDYIACWDSMAVEIIEPDTLYHNYLSYKHIDCYDSLQGEIVLKGIGGWAPYQYSLNGVLYSDSIIDSLPAGAYVIGVVDSAGCQSIRPWAGTDTIVLGQPDSIGAVLTVVQQDNGTSNGAISANVTGGVSPYMYLWTPGSDTTDSIFNLSFGQYTLQVTDRNGCVREFMADVNNVESVEEQLLRSFQLFPNPSVDYLQFDIESQVEAVVIRDNRGRLVDEGHQEGRVDLTSLDEGIYFLEVELIDRTRISKPFVKSNR
jgi:hypothetical protein